MVILQYTGIELTSKKGFEALMYFAQSNNLMDKSVEFVVNELIACEENCAADAYEDYLATIQSAIYF